MINTNLTKPNLCYSSLPSDLRILVHSYMPVDISLNFAKKIGNGEENISLYAKKLKKIERPSIQKWLKKNFTISWIVDKICNKSFHEQAKIKYLDLSESGITDDLLHNLLINCPNIVSLNLNLCTNITTLNSLENVPLLRELSLQSCYSINDFNYLSKLNNIINLIFYCYCFQDFSILKNNSSLRKIDFSHWQTLDLQPLKSLHSLRELTLRNSSIDDSSCLSDLSQITSLELIKCKNIKDFLFLKKLHSLIKLKFDGMHLNKLGENIQNLTQLKELSLINCSVNGREQITSLQVEKLIEK